MSIQWRPQWLFAIVGTVILGAIGSGLWDSLFKPVLPWVAKTIFNIATLGLKQAQDGLYSEIAKGTYERAALDIFNLIMATIFFVAIVSVARGISTLRGAKNDANALKGLQPIIKRKLRIASVVLLSLISGYWVYHAVRMTYVVRAAANIEQYQLIVGPYLSGDQRLTIRSRVAQMSSKDDYEKIITDLGKVASAHKLRVPEFDLY